MGTQDTGRRQTKHKSTIQHITENKKMSNMDPIKTGGEHRVVAKSKQFMPLIRYPPTPWCQVHIFNKWNLDRFPLKTVEGVVYTKYEPSTGADPGFQVRGAHLKTLRRVEEGAKYFGVFRVKNHYFTPKNYIVSNCGGRRENFWGISCEKSRFYAIKSNFFQF